jgi:uncharacterized DUF497 family protein
MRFEWDENKRKENIRKHGFDFADAWKVFTAPMLTDLDEREDYGEDRWIGIGMLDARIVVAVFTEREEDDEEIIRMISLIMNAPNLNKPSETDWARIDAMTDEMIDTSDIPPLPDEFFAKATWRLPRPSVSITVRVEPEVLEWFKSQGDDYTHLMAAALRIYAEAHKDLAAPIRQ